MRLTAVIFAAQATSGPWLADFCVVLAVVLIVGVMSRIMLKEDKPPPRAGC